MKNLFAIFTYCLLIGVFSIPEKSLAAEVDIDKDAIKQTVLNYAEGWYLGDVTKMEKALHPDLAKRGLLFSENNEPSLHLLTNKKLIVSTAGRKGQTMPEGPKLKVEILSIYEDIASVRLDSPWFVDYIHLVKWNGEWLILNVLWESWK